MKVESKYKILDIRKKHFEKEARSCGLSKESYDGIFDEICSDAKKLTKSSLQLPRGFPKFLLESTLNGIAQNLKALTGEEF